jgi:hypothetical protein
MSSMFGCAEMREVAPDLALGTLSGGERAEALLHVNGCARCQALVAELTDVADRLPLLAAELEPPPGFGESTVALMMTGGRRRRRFRFAAAIAAAAAAAAIVSITVVRVTDTTTTTRIAAPPVTAPALRQVKMVGAGGHWAGDVYIAGNRNATLRIEVSYAVPNGAYAIRLSHGTSAPDRLGFVTVMDGNGEWSGPAKLPPGAVSVALVDATGNVVCSAPLGGTAVS